MRQTEKRENLEDLANQERHGPVNLKARDPLPASPLNLQENKYFLTANLSQPA
jgi:hypothetical protein